ncbi:hypothetical protein GCM10022379_23580 [Micromonospora maritima]
MVAKGPYRGRFLPRSLHGSGLDRGVLEVPAWRWGQGTVKRPELFAAWRWRSGETGTPWVVRRRRAPPSGGGAAPGR